jgi:hypothetical protein
MAIYGTYGVLPISMKVEVKIFAKAMISGATVMLVIGWLGAIGNKGTYSALPAGVGIVLMVLGYICLMLLTRQNFNVLQRQDCLTSLWKRLIFLGCAYLVGMIIVGIFIPARSS